MKLHRWVLLLALFGALQAGRAEAHFLFVRILPPAEGGRAAEVYFSELAEAGDPRFLDKIAATQLWLQKTPGAFEPLTVHKAPDRLRAWVPGSGSLVVVGRCDYGVLGRPNQTPFLLRHFPKALAGSPDELNRMKPYGKLPLEVVATCDGDQVRFAALKDGQIVPRAEFVTVDAKLTNTRLTADADGQAAWKPPAPGVYSVYTRDTRKESGEAGGKKYVEIRDFATVAFSWPLARTDADPAAVALFEEAVATRAQWHDFPGFNAQVRGNLDGRPFAGTVTIDAKGEVGFADDEPDRGESVAGWVQEQLESIVLHRLARPAAPDRPRPVLRFAETRDDHPLGRLLVFDGGRFASSYRVKDRQIVVVNRNVGKENMTITVLDNDRNPEGKYLPRSYVVRYWDAATGRLLRTETVQDGWQRVGSWDLPAVHTVTTATDAGLSVRGFTLAKHVLLAGGNGADEFKPEPGFTLLFNGKDLSGWKMARGGESLDGKTEAANGRFKVSDGNLVLDPKVKGDVTINSAKEFPRDVHIKFEFLPGPGCNNDLFLRGVKFDIKQGDVKNLKEGEWHEFEIIVRGDKAEFKCNGQTQRTASAKAGGTPLGVRAELGPIQLRRMRYKEGP